MVVVILAIDIGIRNLSTCELVYDEKQKDFPLQVTRWQLHDFLEYIPHLKSVKKLTANDYYFLAEHFFQVLYNRGYIRSTIHHVVIETQPAGRHLNMKMHLLSHYLYENLVRLRNSSVFGDRLLSVGFVSGHCKYYKPWLQKFGESKQANYGKRKQLSVRLCTNWCLIYNLTTLWNSLQHTKKQDDLADSFLLALYFLHQNYDLKPD